MWALLLLATLPKTEEITYVDMVEINTVSQERSDAYGKNTRLEPIFDQVILWRWSRGRHIVAQYRLVCRYSKGKPEHDIQFSVQKVGNLYYIECWGNDHTYPRWKIKTRVFRSTGGTLDPEREDTKHNPGMIRVPYFHPIN